MKKCKNTIGLIAATLALTGCVNAAQTVQVAATNQTYLATETSTRACPSSTDLGAEYDTKIETNAINESQLNEAILHFTNERRCAQGLQPLAADAGLSRAASDHSADMTRLNFFGHQSPVAGRTSLQNRIDANNVSYSAAAENLAQRSWLQLDPGRPFTVLDRAGCQFAYDGQVVQPHTYRSLAKELVQMWEDSPEHRVNLFNQRYSRLGNGASYKPDPRTCGDIVATQNFAS